MSHSKRVFVLFLSVLLLCSNSINCKKKDKDLKAKQKEIFQKIIIPPPNMIFSALQSSGEIDWKTIIEYNNEINYKAIDKRALNLGFRVADGFVSIMAEDNKNMTAMGKSIKTLAKSIGVGDNVIKKAGEIQLDDAQGTWKKNESKFNEIYSNITNELQKREDYEVAYFINLGAWLEALYISSKSLSTKYDANMAENMRQKSLVDVFVDGHDMLNKKALKKPLIILLKTKLIEIGKLLDFPAGKSLSKENSKKLYEVSAGLKKEIEKL